MFDKILIANRGEIARRVIRTAKKLGVRTVAVYSDADRGALFVKEADEAHRLGPSLASQSYLRGDIVLDIAKRTGAQGIHPGYGFLSENAGFAKACAENGVVFIGPPASAIDMMGSKSASKDIMFKANVPITPGYYGSDQSDAVLKAEAEKIGYPVMIKAVFGGGGRGMRIAHSAKEFNETLEACRREATAAFGNGDVLVEKYVVRPRHVEFQVFADTHGNAVYLFERDCSVQRRHQKVLEEAPAPGMSEQLRASMGASAVAAAQAVGYVGAGTVEFILDQDNNHYFMEMNTRLQVEHPVTEMISGQDLVEWQLKVASGQRLPLLQPELRLNGFALEARIYAERPANNYLPATGTLLRHNPPTQSDSVRVDSGIAEGDTISTFYDAMIAKLITRGETRDEALHLMDRALEQYEVVGVPTNIEFLRRAVKHPAFIAGGVDTGFLQRYKDDVLPAPQRSPSRVVAMASLAPMLLAEVAASRAPPSRDRFSPWTAHSASRPVAGKKFSTTLTDASSAQRSVAVADSAVFKSGFKIDVDGDVYNINVVERPSASRSTWRFDFGDAMLNAVLVADGNKITVVLSGGFQEGSYTFELPEVSFAGAAGKGAATITTPMPGRVIKVNAKAGDTVEAGATVMIVEAMKMEHAIKAPFAGKLESVKFVEGDFVKDGDVLVQFAASK